MPRNLNNQTNHQKAEQRPDQSAIRAPESELMAQGESPRMEHNMQKIFFEIFSLSELMDAKEFWR